MDEIRVSAEEILQQLVSLLALEGYITQDEKAELLVRLQSEVRE